MTVNENVSFTYCTFTIRLLDCSRLAINWKTDNDITISQHYVGVSFFDVGLFLLWSLVTGPSFMSISSLFLELRQFSLARDWPELRKSEIPPSEFHQIYGDWGKLIIPRFSTNFSKEMLLNVVKRQDYSFYPVWVIKGKPTEGWCGGRGEGGEGGRRLNIRVNMPIEKSDKNNGIRVFFIKIFKIYTKNTHITNKYNITRIFLKL